MKPELKLTLIPLREISYQGAYAVVFSRETTIEELVEYVLKNNRLYGVIVVDGKPIVGYEHAKSSMRTLIGEVTMAKRP